jgi:hypothetical protein
MLLSTLIEYSGLITCILRAKMCEDYATFLNWSTPGPVGLGAWLRGHALIRAANSKLSGLATYIATLRCATLLHGAKSEAREDLMRVSL